MYALRTIMDDIQKNKVKWEMIVLRRVIPAAGYLQELSRCGVYLRLPFFKVHSVLENPDGNSG